MIYTSTLYDLGEAIPGVVPTVQTPHVWYDQSKTYDTANIFNELFINYGLVLGDSEDDIWTYQEILEEILRYLNLHIVMIGIDYYIFDWDTARTGLAVQWLDILTGDTKNSTYSIINVDKYMYSSDDTQLTVSDVYNQIQVKANMEELDEVIKSPFDDDSLTEVERRMLYMTEYGTTGSDYKSFIPFTWLLRTDDSDNEDSNENTTYTRKWYMQIFKNDKWSFLKNGIDNYSFIPVGSDGKQHDSWTLLKKLYTDPFISAVVGFGSGSKVDNKNSANIENITIKDKYICISINGNGVDEQSEKSRYRYTPLPAIFPQDTDLENANMRIDYTYGSDGTYSASDENITNYIVFNGSIIMTIPQATIGVSGFNPHIKNGEFTVFQSYNERYNMDTADANNNKDNESQGQYCDFRVFTRKNNNFITAKNYIEYTPNQIQSGYDFRGRLTASDDGDSRGHYYAQKYFKNETPDMGDILLSPPIVQGDLDKRFKYSIADNGKSYYQDDTILYVDILACQLQIGNKYCVEDHNSEGAKTFRWMTTQELEDEGLYHVVQEGNTTKTIYDAYIYLAINIDEGEFLIGESHDIYNNIDSTMGLDTTGMAIPMHASDRLSGDIKFSIIGPVNNTWDNGIRRHPTWFRHTKLTENDISILPHVGQIWIKDFDVEIVSDNGKQTTGKNDDVVYCSDEQKKFIDKKDNINFKFTSTLTAEEATALGVNVTANKSNVCEEDGMGILYITNNITEETDKPEKHYVDAYYREYNDVKIIVETSLFDTNNIKMFNKYRIGYLNRSFYMYKYSRNIKSGMVTVSLKEI